MAIAAEFAAYLAEKGYDPRSSRHSDFLSRIIIRDLVAECPLIGHRAATGQLVANLHHHHKVTNEDWQIDIAMGTCAGTPVPPSTGAPIRMAEPVIIQIAIELKGIMTEHGKQRRNRLKDFDSLDKFSQRYNPRTVRVAFLTINSADCFYSQLNLGKDTLPEGARRPELTWHTTKRRTARQSVKETIDLFRPIQLRHSEHDDTGLDAIAVVVVEHDNINQYPDRMKFADVQKPTIAVLCSRRTKTRQTTLYYIL